MQQMLPGQSGGSDIAPNLLALHLAVDETALNAIPDPWERARVAAELLDHLQQRSAVVMTVRRDAVHELVTKVGATHSKVAELVGLTKARITQLVRAASNTAGGVR